MVQQTVQVGVSLLCVGSVFFLVGVNRTLQTALTTVVVLPGIKYHTSSPYESRGTTQLDCCLASPVLVDSRSVDIASSTGIRCKSISVIVSSVRFMRLLALCAFSRSWFCAGTAQQAAHYDIAVLRQRSAYIVLLFVQIAVSRRDSLSPAECAPDSLRCRLRNSGRRGHTVVVHHPQENRETGEKFKSALAVALLAFLRVVRSPPIVVHPRFCCCCFCLGAVRFYVLSTANICQGIMIAALSRTTAAGMPAQICT